MMMMCGLWVGLLMVGPIGWRAERGYWNTLYITLLSRHGNIYYHLIIPGKQECKGECSEDSGWIASKPWETSSMGKAQNSFGRLNSIWKFSSIAVAERRAWILKSPPHGIYLYFVLPFTFVFVFVLCWAIPCSEYPQFPTGASADSSIPLLRSCVNAQQV